ncbi:ribosome biogenesis regulatory protein-domain-containing protein [Ochromonadaceae sp. CCMP2298]|nr:ribosome biogenesis regulatory protein-domain-containing protein [Ochromonadaceae sp. CCMP2298]
MSKAVSAKDLVPEAYDEGSEEENREDVTDDFDYDPFNLAASNYHTVLITKKTHLEQKLVELALPTEDSDVGKLTLLPDEVNRMPRSYKVPEPKAETVWEKFAKEKGIKKVKKDRMVYDDNNEEYRPRYGYNRANSGLEEIPIVEVKAGTDPFSDPWAAEQTDKRARVKKNLKQQMTNIKKGMKGKGFDSEIVPGIPVDMGKNGKVKRGKGGLKNALQLAQHSTASMGRFDELRPGEPARKLTGRKRTFRDNLGVESERGTMKQQLRFVADKVDKKARGVTNSLAAYEGILPDAPSDGFRQRKGRGKERTAGGAKKGGPSKGKKTK